MKRRFEERVSSWQFMLLVNGCQVSTGLFQIGLLAKGLRTGWISVMLAAGVSMLSLVLMYQTLKKHPDETFPELMQTIFGNKLGKALLVFYIVNQLVVASAVLRMQLELVGMNLLTRTPMIFIAFCTMAAVFIIINRGILAITRLNELLFYFFLVLLLFFLSPLCREAQWTNLLPLYEIDWHVCFQDALLLSLLYGGTGIVWVWYPFVKEKNQVLRRSVTGVFMTMGVYGFMWMVCILVYGADMMEYMLWPVLSLLKLIPNQLIQRSDFFVVGLWIGIGMQPIIHFVFSAIDCAARMKPISPQSRVKLFRYLSAVGCCVVGLAALIPQNIIQGFFYIRILSLYDAYMGVAFPLLIWIGGWLHEKKFCTS